MEDCSESQTLQTVYVIDPFTKPTVQLNHVIPVLVPSFQVTAVLAADIQEHRTPSGPVFQPPGEILTHFKNLLLLLHLLPLSYHFIFYSDFYDLVVVVFVVIKS